MITEYFTRWWDVLGSTADTGNIFLGIWSLGALLLPYVVLVSATYALGYWIYTKTI
jgi:hypothetical protein